MGAFAWLIGALLAAHAILVWAEPFGPSEHLRLSNAFQFTIEALGALLVWAVVLRLDSHQQRGPWLVMAAAATSYMLGIGYVVYLDATGKALTYPSIADVFWLAFPLLASVSFLWRSVRPGDRTQWFVRGLDIIITGLGVFLIAWVGWFEEVVAQSSGDALAQAVTAGYPLGDVMVITALLTFAVRLPRAHWRDLGPLFAGMAVIWATDVFYTWRSIHGDYSTAGIPELGWPLGFALVAIGAITSSRTRADGEARAVSTLDQWLPYIVAAPALAALAYAVSSRAISTTVGGIAIVWMALILVRQLLFFRQSRLAYQALADARIKKAEAEQQLAHLRELTEFKTRFINMAAHELNTPLTPIRLGIATLRSARSASQESQQVLDILERNVMRLVLLLQDILESARIQSDQLRIRKGAVDLARLVRAIAEEQRPRFEAAHVGLALDAPPAAPMVGDEIRLHQVLMNLVDNALKHTPEGGSVALKVEPVEGGWRCAVTDTGQGIAAEDLGRLFQPFSRLDESEGKAGSGLGLSIARSIVERHGGTIQAASAGRGQGSTFTFELPTQPP